MESENFGTSATPPGTILRLRFGGVIDITIERLPSTDSNPISDIDGSVVSQPLFYEPGVSHTPSGEPLFEVGHSVPPPRVGSVNAAVWTLATQLRSPFTRDQFEAVVPKAMRYNPVTGAFGVRTRFEGIKRARQAYFSEFKKRRWLVRVQPAPDRTSDS